MENIFLTKKLIGYEKFYENISLLKNSGRAQQAILIEGEKGGGKRTLALHLGMSLLCRHNESPCFLCSSCKKAISGNHPDISFVHGNDKTGSISVEDIRTLKLSAYVIPHESEKRIFIVENSEKLTIAAQNAFLKILEEPPQNVVFILTTSNRGGLLETVLSRVAIFSLPTLNSQKIEAALLCFGIEEKTAREVAEVSSSVGAALNIIEDKNLSSAFAVAAKLKELILKRNKYEILALLSQYTLPSQRQNYVGMLSLATQILTREAKKNPQYNASSLKRDLDAIYKTEGFL
ncbi:MAG: hypothetical protein RR315_02080, partial [Oscillospiraceae bacterium]